MPEVSAPPECSAYRKLAWPDRSERYFLLSVAILGRLAPESGTQGSDGSPAGSASLLTVGFQENETLITGSAVRRELADACDRRARGTSTSGRLRGLCEFQLLP